MNTGNYGSEPEFDEQIVEEYQRSAAEGFKRPPSTSLRQGEREKPFRWPGIDQRRDTVALQREDLARVIDEPRQQQSVRAGTQWVLEIIDGPLMAIPGTDVVIGRKPGTIPGCTQMQIEDQARTLSKSHVRLTLQEETWVIEDLGSTNGTALFDLAAREAVGGVDGAPGIVPGERVLEPGEPARVGEAFRLGTMHVRLRPLVTQ